MTTRNRRSRIEMRAHFLAEIERLDASIAGKPDTASESGKLKSLKSMLKKRETALRAATITVNGIAANPELKVSPRASIGDKIATTEARLASQKQTLATANEQIAQLPFGITRLEALVASAAQGDDVEMPTDLYPLPGEGETEEVAKTDEEHEAAFIAKSETEEEGAGDLK